HHGAEGVGVVYFGGWQTPQKKRIKSTKWTTVCASPGSTSVIVDGQNVGTAKTDSFHNQDLVINRGKYGAEKSDFAVMEVITWNYILTKREMEEASTYLMKKLMVGGEKDM
ncbi:ANKRD50, partial [Symbiodinium sp. KB8]